MNIGGFAIFAVIGAFASATQDIAVDAWRIDVADEKTPVELLSAVYQFGYRIASIVGGAFALLLAARMPWGTVYWIMAGLVMVMMVVAMTAPDTQRPPSGVIEEGLEQAGEISAKVRLGALAIVGVCWLWAIVTLARFMVSMLTAQQNGVKPPSVTDFTTHVGPWIIVATVFVPLLISAIVNWLKAHGRGVQNEAQGRGSRRPGGDEPYLRGSGARRSPNCRSALRWGVLIIIGFILTYALCYNIWSSFAFPFYLDFLHYTKDQVAFASKVFGIFMTMIGISLGGYLFGRIGRFPTVLIGAAVTPLGNLVYADLAEGGPNIDRFTHFLRLNSPARLVRGRRPHGPPAGRDQLREYRDRRRPHRIRRLSVGHHQPEIHRRPICAAVVADVPGRLARPRVRRRSVRQIWLAAGVPLDRRGGPARGSVRAPRMVARAAQGARSGENAPTPPRRRSTEP